MTDWSKLNSLMPKKFIQLSSKTGYMKHNGGLLFREISKNEYEFKTKIEKNHLNMAGITHGGYIASIIDAGAGTGAHRSTDGKPCVTVSLDIKFIGSTDFWATYELPDEYKKNKKQLIK